jgi:kinesin family protein C2/C3
MPKYIYVNLVIVLIFFIFTGGQAKTLMFVQINPDVESYSETISTLKFAERVSGVELGAARSNKEGKDIKELLEQVIILQLLFDLSLIGVCLLSWKSNMRKMLC